MNEIEFDKILHLNSKSGKRVYINDHIICEFVAPADLEDWQTYVYFSEQWRDTNCPRYTCYADVKVYDCKKFISCRGRLYHNCDLDLDSRRSFMLFMYDSQEAKTPSSSVTVSSCVLEDSIYPIKELLKLIKFKTGDCKNAKDPYDSHGLTIVQFDEVNRKSPAIEYNVDGKLYYEIVDFNDYKDGEFIPLDSPRRSDVIPFVKLTKDNVQELADKINASLEKLYASAR